MTTRLTRLRAFAFMSLEAMVRVYVTGATTEEFDLHKQSMTLDDFEAMEIIVICASSTSREPGTISPF
jgi:hypothetical protein